MEFEQAHLVIGNLQIRYYGIIIVVALLVGAYVASLLASRGGRDSDHIWGGLTWAIVPGIIGARLWFVLFPPVSLIQGCGIEGEVCQNTAWFFENFFDTQNGAIAIWSGGLSIFGGFIGGALGVYLYLSAWHNRIIGLLTTLLTPVLWLAQILEWLFQALAGRVTGKDVAAFRYQRPASTFPDEGMRLSPWMDIAGVSIPLGQAIRPLCQLREPGALRRADELALGHTDPAGCACGALRELDRLSGRRALPSDLGLRSALEPGRLLCLMADLSPISRPPVQRRYLAAFHRAVLLRSISAGILARRDRGNRSVGD